MLSLSKPYYALGMGRLFRALGERYAFAWTEAGGALDEGDDVNHKR